jgi:nucleotide-binding universal stress UspA family protein
VFPDLQREVEDAARARLQELIADADPGAVPAEPVVVTSNAPALAIVGYAKEANVDLIVMGTHGRGAVAHLLVGSVAERVVRCAPCPVLTVRHPEHEFIVADELSAAAKS